MKKFKTIQSLQKYFNDNIDLIMQEQKEIAGKIKTVLDFKHILKSINSIVMLHEYHKKHLSINKLNNDKELIFWIVPHLYDLPRSYKYAKNFTRLRIICNSTGIAYCFNRGCYNLGAPKQIEISCDFLTNLEIELLQEKLEKL